MSLRPRLGTVITDLSWRLYENPRRLYALSIATLLIAPLVFAALNGSSIILGLQVAGLQAGVLVVSSLFIFALRRSGLM